MATMISEVYDAFRSVGVPEDKARAAAEALSERLERAATANVAKSREEMIAEIATPQPATAIDLAIQEQSAAFERIRKNLVLMKWGLVVVIVVVAIPLIKPYWMHASLH
jgi:hypothetical protein